METTTLGYIPTEDTWEKITGGGMFPQGNKIKLCFKLLCGKSPPLRTPRFRSNVELFMRQTKLIELSSWKVRRLARQFSSSEWVWIVQHVLSVYFRRIGCRKIVSGTNPVDLHMPRIKLISNGNRTEWSPIRSVIIRVINKIGRPRNGSPICLITSLITKFCYQLIITVTKFVI